jgi:glycerol-3-phosphate dehydrogenase (NAD(P)+)
MRFGIIGSGSWGTALAKILTDNGNHVYWNVRSEKMANHISQRHHNPNYLSSVYFDTKLLTLHTNPANVFENADYIIVATPSAYVAENIESYYQWV